MDPLHELADAPVTWTTVNLNEAFPGVATPLSWTVLGRVSEDSTRRAFASMGVLRSREVNTPDEFGKRFYRTVFGHTAANLDLFKQLADRIPGTSAAALEHQIFGGAAGPGDGRGQLFSRKKSLRVLVMAPYAIWKSRRYIIRAAPESMRWWQQNTGRSKLSLEEARQLLVLATDNMTNTFARHAVVSMAAQGIYERVRSQLSSPDQVGGELDFLSGGGVAEAATAAALWHVSRKRADLAAFLREHGFHAPDDGELSSRSWREDQRPVVKLVEVYSQMADKDAPASVRGGRGKQLPDDVRAAIAAPSWALRRIGQVGKHFIALRESGRAAFLRYLDVARFAARQIGAALVELDLLDDAEDVFYLTKAELFAPPDDARQLVGERRQLRIEYKSIELPATWVGEPSVEVRSDEVTEATQLQGIGASAGKAEGPARVILDPGDGVDLEPGEILVCHTTDPSWAAYFVVAKAAVIDIGGPMSHGAIVARELNLPCVINATNASRTIRTGDYISLDGSTGQVEIIKPATDGAPVTG